MDKKFRLIAFLVVLDVLVIAAAFVMSTRPRNIAASEILVRRSQKDVIELRGSDGRVIAEYQPGDGEIYTDLNDALNGDLDQ